MQLTSQRNLLALQSELNQLQREMLRKRQEGKLEDIETLEQKVDKLHTELISLKTMISD
ncbi:hypothetical protein [Marinoscillum sp. 108]|jgi:hypothetical protein|uniref:Uncharacterized protein n=1 Tax=Marinoscillum luteum TaxID=861051 RepID=A0ABW7N7S1_9BACT|nr:hypothetical protein [Marinoscillum sp. 108]VXD11522.1 conserved hypothetical protein [Marinoscillum sp. 108]